MARKDKARQGKTRQENARQGMAMQDNKTRHGNARQLDKARKRQGKARPG